MQKMKASRNLVGLFVSILATVAAALLITGCETEQPYESVAGVAGLPQSVTNAPAIAVPVPGKTNNADAQREVFHVTDLVVVMRVAGEVKFDPWSEHIREDGKVSPPEIEPVKCAERTVSDVQREMQAKYEKIYKGITVTVTAGDRYYHVFGEVNAQGPKPYLGRTDIVQAISSAGGLTEYASFTMYLIHADGKSYRIDFKKAILGDPKHDLPVFPGDKIVVRRRPI
jgi:polysaccharide export outer membrane protein